MSSPLTLWASSTWWQDPQVAERHTPAINYIYIIEPKQAYPDLTVLCRFFDGISLVFWPSIPSKLKTKGHNSFWEFSKEKVLWFVTNSQKLRTWGFLILPQVFKNLEPEVLWFVTNFQKPRTQGSFICWRKTQKPKTRGYNKNQRTGSTTRVIHLLLKVCLRGYSTKFKEIRGLHSGRRSRAPTSNNKTIFPMLLKTHMFLLSLTTFVAKRASDENFNLNMFEMTLKTGEPYKKLARQRVDLFKKYFDRKVISAFWICGLNMDQCFL